MKNIDDFIDNTKADIKIGGTFARYNFRSEIIDMPEPTTFESKAAYYVVLFHELIHWAVDNPRLGISTARFLGRLRNNPAAYDFEFGYEELRAHIGAGLLCIHFGLNPDSHIDRPRLLEKSFKQVGYSHRALKFALREAKRTVRFLLSL